MKTFKFGFILLLMCCIGTINLLAQEEFSNSIGVAAKSSTNGFGGDAVYRFHKRMSVRLGYEKLALTSNFHFDESSVDYQADVDYKTGSISMLFDYYLIGDLFASAGAGWNMFDGFVTGRAASDLKYGDIQIPKKDIGTFGVEIMPSEKVSPYFGLGYGRTLGMKRKVGFAVELGGFYQGPSELKLTSTGLLSPSSNQQQEHAARLEKQIEQYTIYPVLRFSLSYKILNF